MLIRITQQLLMRGDPGSLWSASPGEKRTYLCFEPMFWLIVGCGGSGPTLSTVQRTRRADGNVLCLPFVAKGCPWPSDTCVVPSGTEEPNFTFYFSCHCFNFKKATYVWEPHCIEWHRAKKVGVAGGDVV